MVMDPKFFRKYADIITEAEMAPEGVPSAGEVTQAIQTKLKPEEQKALIAMAEKIVGKPLDQLTPQEAQKYGPQFEKALKGGGMMEAQLNELNLKAAWDTAKSKLLQLGFLGGLTIGTGAAVAGGDYMSAGTMGGMLLMSLSGLAGAISDLPDEYRAHKELQTATDPKRQSELKNKISYMNR
jgi:hypothetical protein